MKRALAVFATVSLFAVSAFGQNQSEKVVSATRIDTVRVPTIQCGSCKMTIEKALKALDGVKSAQVDLKKKVVAVEFLAAKLDLGKIETAITKAGYAANDKKADPEAYEKLDECCKVPDSSD